MACSTGALRHGKEELARTSRDAGHKKRWPVLRESCGIVNRACDEVADDKRPGSQACGWTGHKKRWPVLRELCGIVNKSLRRRRTTQATKSDGLSSGRFAAW